MPRHTLPSIPAADFKAKSVGALLIDVRKRPAASASGRMVAGARWVDPYSLTFAHPLFQGVRPLLFYCVHGHEVSQFAAAMAAVAGCDAAFVEGGLEALCEEGVDLVPLEGDL